MFANQYISKNIVYPPFIEEEISHGVNMIVMIPCLNEPEIIKTLQSLWACDKNASRVEVVVTINDSETSSPLVKENNERNYRQLIEWKRNNDRNDLALFPIYARSVNAKHAGAGMARKIGMDEVIRRFNQINKPDGIIVSLDADCVVSSNYLKVIEDAFTRNKSCFAATLNFKHRIEELADEKQQKGIRLYEEYLHYYKKAIDFTGYPNSIYTIGSAFAVRADAYVKQGGMNRRQAGEDFYFLNKLTSLGKLVEINEVFVYPSARVSDRVPFGTGAAMSKWMCDADDLALTYNFSAFLDLKTLFDRVDSMFEQTTTVTDLIGELSLPMQDYLEQIAFQQKLEEIRKNSSTAPSFKKRFFQFFDGLVILRFLNFVHQSNYSRQNILEAIEQLKKHALNRWNGHVCNVRTNRN